MDATRVSIVVAIGVVAAGIGLGGVPLVMLTQAGRMIDASGCGADGAAPDAEFFAALELADRAAAFPGFRVRADALTSAASMTCMEHFNGACSALRDAAVDDARDEVREALTPTDGHGGTTQLEVDSDTWRDYLDAGERDALCERWAPWRTWLDEHGIQSNEACAVCADGNTPDEGSTR